MYICSWFLTVEAHCPIVESLVPVSMKKNLIEVVGMPFASRSSKACGYNCLVMAHIIYSLLFISLWSFR